MWIAKVVLFFGCNFRGQGHREEISRSWGKEGQGANSDSGKERTVIGASLDARLASSRSEQ